MSHIGADQKDLRRGSIVIMELSKLDELIVSLLPNRCIEPTVTGERRRRMSSWPVGWPAALTSSPTRERCGVCATVRAPPTVFLVDLP